MTPEYFQQLAKYNQWANIRLYDACAELPRTEYYKSRGAFFDSIHGTLNHLIAIDRLWLGRLTSMDAGIIALDLILFENFEDLHEARLEEDEKIIQMVNELDNSRLNTTYHYKNTAGKAMIMPVNWTLAHLFNHQTHHRGQVHNMISQTKIIEAPVLDLFYFLHEKHVV